MNGGVTMKKNEQKGCPKCGCDSFYAKVFGRQYYTAKGEPAGYEVDGETKTLFCYKCGYKTTLERLVKQNETA